MSGSRSLAGEATALRPVERDGTLARVAIGALQLVFALLLLALFAYVARQVYHPNNVRARALMNFDAGYYHDLYTRAPRNAGLVPLLLGFAVVLAGPGWLALRALGVRWHDGMERLLFSIMAGMAVVTFATMVLAWRDQIRPATSWALLAACAAMTAWYGVEEAVRLSRSRAGWPDRVRRLRPTWNAAGCLVLLALVLAALYLALLGALGPEVQFDALWYHLGVPARYVQHGGFYDIVRETRVTGAALPPYQEVLYTLLIPISGVIGAKLLHWVDLLLAAVTIVFFCRRWLASTGTGLLAAAIFVSLPVVTWSASTGSNDLPSAFLTVLAVHAYLSWEKSRDARWLVLLGISLGYGIGVKPFAGFGLAMLVAMMAVSLALWRRRAGLGPALRRAGVSAVAVAVPTILCCVPWLVYSYRLTGNPVFPGLNEVFHSPYWTPGATAYARMGILVYGHHHTWLTLLRLLWDTAVNPYQYRSIIGPVALVLSPALLLALVRVGGPRGHVLRLLAVFTLGCVLLWYASEAVEVRYLYGATAIGTVVVAFAVTALPGRDVGGHLLRAAMLAIALCTIVLNSQLLVPIQPNSIKTSIAGRADLPWTYLYGTASTRDIVDWEPMIDYINAHLSPAHDKVYVAHPIFIDSLYSRVEFFNGFTYDAPGNLGQWGLGSPDALQHLRGLGIDYVVVSPGDAQTLQHTPLGPHLRTVHVSQDGVTLLRVVDT